MVQAKGSAMAAVAKGSIEGGLTIPLLGERIRSRSVPARRAACRRPVSRDMRKRATTRKKATMHPPDWARRWAWAAP